MQRPGARSELRSSIAAVAAIGALCLGAGKVSAGQRAYSQHPAAGQAQPATSYAQQQQPTPSYPQRPPTYPSQQPPPGYPPQQPPGYPPQQPPGYPPQQPPGYPPQQPPGYPRQPPPGYPPQQPPGYPPQQPPQSPYPAQPGQAYQQQPAPYRPAQEPPAESRYGAKGIVAIDSSVRASFSHTSRSGQSTSAFSLQPSLLYFVTNGLGIGGGLSFSYTSGESTSNTLFGIGPQLVYDISLGPSISLVPDVSIAYLNGSRTQGNQSVGNNNVVMQVGTTFLFHVLSHVSVGVGPSVIFDLFYKEGDREIPKGVRFSLASALVFWF